MVKGKIPGITTLASTNALNAVENKLLNVSNLVKKSDYNTRINEIKNKISDPTHDKYITAPKFNTLTAKDFATRLTQATLDSKDDISNFVKKTDLDNKLKL